MELQQDNSVDDLTKPQVFLSQINTLKEKLPSILEDFVKYYIFYNKNPEYNEYQQMFDNIKGNLQNINSELFMTSNNVDKSTETINDRLQKINISCFKVSFCSVDLTRRASFSRCKSSTV